MGPSVLVVSADAVLRERLSRELSAAGCRVRVAGDAAAAQRAAVLDLVIVDTDGADGFERLRQVVSRPGSVSPPVLALTAANDDAAADLARSLGARGRLVKPVDGLRLLSHVRRLVDGATPAWLDDPGPGSQRPSPFASPAAPGAVRRILSVEDVEVNQELVRLFLDEPNYAIDRAPDGDTALTALRDSRYDLMLLDLRLPGIGGLELARLVRCTEGAGPRLPIVAVTADVAPQTVAAAYAAGMDEVLAKPFTAAALRAAVARRLGLDAPADPPETASGLTGVLEAIGRRHGQPIVTRMLASFMAQLGRVAMLDDGDAAGVGAQAHAIKGAAAGLGFADVSLACGDLELACRTGQNVHAQLLTASSTCARVRGEIEARLKLAA